MALSSKDSFEDLHLNIDDLETRTSIEQRTVENSIESIFATCMGRNRLRETFPLHRTRHISYLYRGLRQLSDSYECLDASRPWLCYWIIHSLNLLGEKLSNEHQLQIGRFLKSVQDEAGGFAGNIGQMAHLADTYAAVSAICSLDLPECFDMIDCNALAEFIRSVKHEDGSICMHKDGELDVRGAYCATVAASLCGIMDKELFSNTAEWIAKCQTYEGGFGSQPGTEAHGGYTFCALAALILLNRTELIDLDQLLNWAVHRQMKFEGGFQGRTNKMVDGCYSFWQGGIFPLIHHVMSRQNAKLDENCWLFDQTSLQDYILLCCQYPSGGLIDKPGKSRDYYHTCYCLSGLSVSQHCFSGSKKVQGDPNNLLEPTHPVFNICVKKVGPALKYFNKKSVFVVEDNDKDDSSDT